MRVNIYRLKAWNEDEKPGYQFDFEFKDEEYQEVKTRLKRAGYRVRELFAWN